MSVLIKGGRVITAADDYVADIFIEGERISLIGESLDVTADKVIDASGKYVLPGAVDPHTHLEMPWRQRNDRVRPRLADGRAQFANALKVAQQRLHGIRRDARKRERAMADRRMQRVKRRHLAGVEREQIHGPAFLRPIVRHGGHDAFRAAGDEGKNDERDPHDAADFSMARSFPKRTVPRNTQSTA